MGTIRAAIGMLVVVGGFFLIGTSAEAQTDDDGGQYVPGGPVFGDLVFEGDAIFGTAITIVGEGFGPAAVVQLDVRDNATGSVVSTSEHQADGAGLARVELVLEDPISPGRYTATLSGQSPDGATVELSGGLVVETESQDDSEPNLTDDDGQLAAGERNADGSGDGDSALASAESGGGSNLALFGGAALLVVVLGGGAAFLVSRRKPTL